VSAIYNELEPYAVQWLRNLVAAGHITPGVVDGRSIKDLTPADITTPQAHFFAGIGVWSHALREAGFPDDFNVWSGSCPCQPFSAAGRRAGITDARHLWPDWFHLIRECRPACVVGEQVASPDGLAWLDAVQADMEGAGYAFTALDFCAAGVGAPHIRQRLYFAAVRLDAVGGLAHHHQQGLCRVSSDGSGSGLASRNNADGRGASERLADATGDGLVWRRADEARNGRDAARLEPQRLRDARRLGHADIHGARWDAGTGAGAEGGAGVWAVGDATRAPGAAGRLGFAGFAGLEGHARDENASRESRRLDSQSTGPTTTPSPTRGFWSDVEWLPCRDGKWRPTQPGLLPLAYGAASRVGRLRAYGNAIVAPQAVAFLRALRPSVAHLFGRQEAA